LVEQGGQNGEVRRLPGRCAHHLDDFRIRNIPAEFALAEFGSFERGRRRTHQRPGDINEANRAERRAVHLQRRFDIKIAEKIEA